MYSANASYHNGGRGRLGRELVSLIGGLVHRMAVVVRILGVGHHTKEGGVNKTFRCEPGLPCVGRTFRLPDRNS